MSISTDERPAAFACGLTDPAAAGASACPVPEADGRTLGAAALAVIMGSLRYCFHTGSPLRSRLYT